MHSISPNIFGAGETSLHKPTAALLNPMMATKSLSPGITRNHRLEEQQIGVHHLRVLSFLAKIGPRNPRPFQKQPIQNPDSFFGLKYHSLIFTIISGKT